MQLNGKMISFRGADSSSPNTLLTRGTCLSPSSTDLKTMISAAQNGDLRKSWSMRLAIHLSAAAKTPMTSASNVLSQPWLIVALDLLLNKEIPQMWHKTRSIQERLNQEQANNSKVILHQVTWDLLSRTTRQLWVIFCKPGLLVGHPKPTSCRVTNKNLPRHCKLHQNKWVHLRKAERMGEEKLCSIKKSNSKSDRPDAIWELKFLKFITVNAHWLGKMQLAA